MTAGHLTPAVHNVSCGKDETGQKIYGRIHSPGNEPSAITVGAATPSAQISGLVIIFLLYGLLILYYRANPGGVGRPNPEEALLEEIRQAYRGKVVTGHDLDIF